MVNTDLLTLNLKLLTSGHKDSDLIEFNSSYFCDMIKTSIGRLRLLGYLEGLSFLGLLGIAVPLKYLNDMPEATKIIGMIHGVLFIFYVIFLLEVRSDHKWDFRTTILSFIAAFLPFGTFVADVKIFKGYSGKQ